MHHDLLRRYLFQKLYSILADDLLLLRLELSISSVTSSFADVIFGNLLSGLTIFESSTSTFNFSFELEVEDFLLAFKMHLLNNQILIQKVVGGMKKNSFGRIINIISTSVKAPIPGLGVSNTIRAAVANWAKTLSLELGSYGITVNNVLPGFTNTNRLKSLIEKKSSILGKSKIEVENEMKKSVPLNRFGEASEVANAAIFLSSPAASYINGINLPVDGGRTSSL